MSSVTDKLEGDTESKVVEVPHSAPVCLTPDTGASGVRNKSQSFSSAPATADPRAVPTALDVTRHSRKLSNSSAAADCSGNKKVKRNTSSCSKAEGTKVMRNPSTSSVVDASHHSPASSGADTTKSLLTPPPATGAPPSPGKLSSPPVLLNLSRAQTYKDQRKKYRCEKKRAAKERLTTLKDPSVVVWADQLKVRGTLKTWTRLWCVLKPGVLLLYRSTKASQWCGTVLLSSCELIERPSKKEGFCFKLYHPLEQSIWAAKGPKGEAIGAVVQPLPTSHLIFRAASQDAGKCWMDAVELSMRCSSLLLRSMTATPHAAVGARDSWNENEGDTDGNHHSNSDSDSDVKTAYLQPPPRHFSSSASDCSDRRRMQGGGPSSVSSDHEEAEYDDEESGDDLTEDGSEEELEPEETSYLENTEDLIGGGSQQEELADENKSLIWCLLKQVRPGMDLSRVVLPTFILEPRSFLDKLSDYYYHADLLALAATKDDPYERMKGVVKWYLSGFYKKPKGLKKPYNPILGETFRCHWRHPNGSRTFYVAEQVSHHPPVSAMYVVNRREGFAINMTVLAKSKFYGNSTSAILDGSAKLSLLDRGETYSMTLPYAHCKGILVGVLSLELGGKVSIECSKTGYSAELEFKLRPFLSGVDANNVVSGRLKLGKETLATLGGRWDAEMTLTSKRTQETETLWDVSQAVKDARLPRSTVDPAAQCEWESERLWTRVSAAIAADDQTAATEEKSVLEERQRAALRERQAKEEEWTPRHFTPDAEGTYQYRHADQRPWDARTDLYQYERDYVVRTNTRHRDLETPRAVGSPRHVVGSVRGSVGGARGVVVSPRGVVTSLRAPTDVMVDEEVVDGDVTCVLTRLERAGSRNAEQLQHLARQITALDRKVEAGKPQPLPWAMLLLMLLLSVVVNVLVNKW